MQAAIISITNTGKSSLLKALSNASPLIADYKFTTKEPIIGMMNFENTQIQLIENPAIESEYYDKGLTNTADTLLIILEDLKDLEKIESNLTKARGKRILIINKIDLLSKDTLRKLKATLQSKKHNFSLISIKSKQGLEELKEKIFQSFPIIRVFTKEPGKPKSDRAMILSLDSNVKDVAEKILKGFSEKIKDTKIWGPSSKFPGQIVSLKHKVKDMDTIEFKTK